MQQQWNTLTTQQTLKLFKTHTGQASCRNGISLALKGTTQQLTPSDLLQKPVCISGCLKAEHSSKLYMLTSWRHLCLQNDSIPCRPAEASTRECHACTSHTLLPVRMYVHGHHQCVWQQTMHVVISTDVHLDLSKNMNHSYMYATWCSLKPSDNKQCTQHTYIVHLDLSKNMNHSYMVPPETWQLAMHIVYMVDGMSWFQWEHESLIHGVPGLKPYNYIL